MKLPKKKPKISQNQKKQNQKKVYKIHLNFRKNLKTLKSKKKNKHLLQHHQKKK